MHTGYFPNLFHIIRYEKFGEDAKKKADKEHFQTQREKFLKPVRDYPGDIRWMFTEISNKIPAAADIIRKVCIE
jgi:hypothetical protein